MKLPCRLNSLHEVDRIAIWVVVGVPPERGFDFPLPSTYPLSHRFRVSHIYETHLRRLTLYTRSFPFLTCTHAHAHPRKPSFLMFHNQNTPTNIWTIIWTCFVYPSAPVDRLFSVGCLFLFSSASACFNHIPSFRFLSS